jgi:hypothetical protein
MGDSSQVRIIPSEELGKKKPRNESTPKCRRRPPREELQKVLALVHKGMRTQTAAQQCGITVTTKVLSGWMHAEFGSGWKARAQ